MTRLPLSVEAKLGLGSEGERHLATRIQQMGLPKPEREYRFDPERRWRFDFAWPEYRLAVEVEGAVWAQGRHTRGSGYVKDTEKYNAAAKVGWMVIRYATEQVMDDSAMLDIKAWFDARAEAQRLNERA